MNTLKIYTPIVVSLTLILSACDNCESDFISQALRGNKGLESSCQSSSSTPSATLATISPSDATLSDSAKLEVVSGSNAVVSLKSTGTASGDSCVPGSNTVGVGLQDTVDQFSQAYTPTETVLLEQIKDARIYRTGTNPTGNVYISVQSDNSGQPDGTELAQSSVVDASTMGSSIINKETFTFSTAVQLESGSTYHFVLVGAAGFSGGGDSVRWAQAFNSDTNCDGGPFASQIFTDDGSTWNTANSNSKPSELGLIVTSFASDSPTAAYSFNSNKSAASWDISTFSASINAQREPGTITFDMGASDSSTASYSLTGQTLSQIQAASDLTGQYLFLRATFASDGKQDASLGGMSLQYQ